MTHIDDRPHTCLLLKLRLVPADLWVSVLCCCMMAVKVAGRERARRRLEAVCVPVTDAGTEPAPAAPRLPSRSRGTHAHVPPVCCR